MPVNERINATSGTRIKPGGTRLITTGEIGLSRALYNYGIRYNTVWIHRESYLPFNLQPIDIAMSPDGEYGLGKIPIRMISQWIYWKRNTGSCMK